MLASILTTHNFKALADTLPVERVQSLLRDLALAVTGPLIPEPKYRQPVQLESQHIVGAALRLAGAAVVYPTLTANQAKAPDFTLTIEARTHGIEVKRPESKERLLPSIDNARDKFVARRQIGIVVVDVTDYLLDAEPTDPYAVVDQLRQAIRSRILDGGLLRYRTGYESVAMAMVFARVPLLRLSVVPPLISFSHIVANAFYGDEERHAIGHAVLELFRVGFDRMFPE